MAKRIDKKDITEGSPLVLPAGHPDTVFLNPNNYISIKGTTTDYTKYQVSSPYQSSANLDASSSGETSTTINTIVNNQLDVPQLTDIESVNYEQYYDTVSKLAKIKVTLKIRNSNKNPNNVAGVDARIYNPNA